MSETTPAVGQLQTFKQGHVGHVVFSNPGKFNAVNYQMWCDLPVAMGQFAQDPDVRLIVLSGAGEKAFVSGADISQFDTQRTGGDAANTYNQASEAGYAAVLDCPKPTLAKIRGVCMGGGLGLALNCDVRICADDVRFRMPAGRLGLGYAPICFTAPASSVRLTLCTWAWSSRSPVWLNWMLWSMPMPPMCAKTRR
jgi:enoyl-CoA hydratase